MSNYVEVFVEKNVFLKADQISKNDEAVSYEYTYPEKKAGGWDHIKVTEKAHRQASGAYHLVYGHGPDESKELIVVSKPDDAGVVKAMAGATIKITKEAARHFGNRDVSAVRAVL